MKILRVLILTALLFLPGCWLFDIDDDYEFEFETIITDIPANLDGINSDRDDFNSDLPFHYWGNILYFSSDKQTNGVNFDIKYEFIEITYHPDKDDIVNISYTMQSDIYHIYEDNLFPLINTDFNEYGPYTYWGPEAWNYFFYANDEGGDLDIKFVYNSGYYDTGEELHGPLDANILNSESDDAYPAITVDGNRILFCSNREDNQFDIYSTTINGGTILYDDLINRSSVIITKETVLSGSQNDKCPSINNNLLVFTSDREGGFGGFDLYYSLYANGKWTDPVNFGYKINTEYDEYRPISFSLPPMTDDVMIFSSNRPGGKGGYDLYCVRIGDLIDDLF